MDYFTGPFIKFAYQLSAKRSVERLSLRVGSVFHNLTRPVPLYASGFFYSLMAKELPWFKWSPSKWDTGNIQMCSHQSKGIFTDMCSLYWSRVGELPYALALQRICNGDASALHELSEYEIFRVEDGFVRIDFLDEQLAEFGQASDKRRKAAEKRWSGHIKKDPDASALQVHMQSNAIKSREEEKREETPAPTLEEIKESLFGASEERWVDEMIRLYGKWGPTEFDKCHQYHINTASPPIALWQWRQKFGTWLSIKNDRASDKEIKTPEPYDKFAEAEYNKTLWVLPEWEKFYSWRLNNEPDFRKHFGYGELQKGAPVGSRNNGRGGPKGTHGPEG